MRRVLLTMLLLAAAASARAQEITGTITGVVKDETGAIVPGAMGFKLTF